MPGKSKQQNLDAPPHESRCDDAASIPQFRASAVSGWPNYTAQRANQNSRSVPGQRPNQYDRGRDDRNDNADEMWHSWLPVGVGMTMVVPCAAQAYHIARECVHFGHDRRHQASCPAMPGSTSVCRIPWATSASDRSMKLDDRTRAFGGVAKAIAIRAMKGRRRRCQPTS